MMTTTLYSDDYKNNDYRDDDKTLSKVMMTTLCQVPLFRLNSVLKQPGRRDEEDEEPERQQWDK